MNDAKSAPFAHIPYVKNPCIPPKISKNPQFRQISRNSLTIFRFEQREMEPSKFTANYAKIAQSATPSHESREIHAILKKIPPILAPQRYPNFLQQIPRNSLTSQRFRAIDAKLTHFTLIPTNILVYFSDSRKTGFNTLLTRITRNS